jgi:chemotaxis protein CheC
MITELTVQQQDSLTELVNIAFGRAAASLSELTGQRVLLSVPRVTIHPINQLQVTLGQIIQGEVASVHQIFTGPVAGDAMLLLNLEGALALSELLTEDRVPLNRLDASDREVLAELGNIILNACLGTFGNLLKVHISFSVPRMQVDALEGLLKSLVVDQQELRYALVVITDFTLKDSTVSGCLVMVLGVASLKKLLDAVEHLG